MLGTAARRWVYMFGVIGGFNFFGFFLKALSFAVRVRYMFRWSFPGYFLLPLVAFIITNKGAVCPSGLTNCQFGIPQIF
jgi:hypothetical protein